MENQQKHEMNTRLQSGGKPLATVKPSQFSSIDEVQFNAGHALKFLKAINKPNDVVYIFIKGGLWGPLEGFRQAGYYSYDMFAKLADDVKRLSGKVVGIYCSINTLSASCIRKSANCLRPMTEVKALSTGDVLRRRILLVDVDSCHPPNAPATSEEKYAAKLLSVEIRNFLRSEGWPEPVIVNSGNGYQLHYGVDLPADSSELIRGCLRALAGKFNTEAAIVDTSVFDAPRFARLPGTMNCKGVNSSERPFSMAELFKPPAVLVPVTVEKLEKLAGLYARPAVTRAAAPTKVARTKSIPSEKVIAAARAYLEKLPPAVSGDNGRNKFLNAACRLVDDFALAVEQAAPLLDEYNARCVPPFSESEVQDKLRSALKKVAEGGGPTGRCLNTKRSVKSSRGSVDGAESPSPFHGFVTDFGLACRATIHMPIAKFEKLTVVQWATLYLISQKQRSDVLIPDVFLRQLIFGSAFNRNWRSRLKQRLKAALVDESVTCDVRRCPLAALGIRHQHYSEKFSLYGVWEKLRAFEPMVPLGPRVYQPRSMKNAPVFKQLKSFGDMYYAYWPALLFGRAKAVGWSASIQRLLTGLVYEITRSAKSSRGDVFNGDVFKGDQAVPSVGTKLQVICPFLSPSESYVVFGGNGQRRGQGYCIVGSTGKGWLHRSGYENILKAKPEDRAKAIATFLTDLKRLSQDLDLVVAATGPGGWKNLHQMLDCLRTGNGRDWLDACVVRVFAPADWRHRWRAFFSRKLGFSWIPASAETSDTQGKHEFVDPKIITTISQVEDLRKARGWTQQELANQILQVTGKACSNKRVQRHLAGKSKSKAFFKAVETIRLGRESDTSSTNSHEPGPSSVTEREK